MIVLKALSKSFTRETAALADINLTIKTGEVFGIVGESGAGKSTLLHLLNLLSPPTKGEILLDGVDPWQLTEQERRQLRQKIGTIFQTPHLLANRTVLENIALPLKLQGRKDSAKVNELLNFVGLGDKGRAYPRQLSGGQQQRVAIARALVTEPAMILCDEPTSALDERTTLEILTLLKQAQTTFQPTIVFVSHELTAVKYLCQNAAILAAGKLQEVTPVRQRAIVTDTNYTQQVLARLQA
ncbi:ATP-binding cassette domain-containing protein [Enterococcus nangangensis]|uniref:ATP-binding cassette domain-containing protein n=1 Tax=Enterococcus nangangensis TaxID=2559926 RepID=UPI0010F9D920|nr:ATP-binding cassette domain-containing protein [Enterococcus nangangensis]